MLQVFLFCNKSNLYISQHNDSHAECVYLFFFLGMMRSNPTCFWETFLPFDWIIFCMKFWKCVLSHSLFSTCSYYIIMAMIFIILIHIIYLLPDLFASLLHFLYIIYTSLIMYSLQKIKVIYYLHGFNILRILNILSHGSWHG